MALFPRHDRTVVPLHEPSETVLITGLTKKAATDQLFLNTPETWHAAAGTL
ncbi:MAG: hypothetical protein GY926_16625 [bacterium]|nr:hypothetical protein [bacterium]MCP4966840.1 hypothetical protein [bacterium]